MCYRSNILSGDFMKIYVLRHGESEYNLEGKIQGHIDIPLAESGKIQARQTALCLIDTIGAESIQAIYSSDLTRAKQTAQFLIDYLEDRGYKVPVFYTEELREINLGVWEGKTREQLKNEKEEDGKSLFEKWLENPREVVPDGAESMPHFFQRVKDVFLEIASERRDKKGDVVIFTHSGAISMILNYISGRNPDNFIRYSVGNASGIVLDYKDNRFDFVLQLDCPANSCDKTGTQDVNWTV
jgi:broad specificity phosphatase PhoE